MASLPRPDNRLYLGKGGSGKTTLALAHSWKFSRAILCDPTGCQDAFAEGATVTDNPAELVDLVRAPSPWRVCFRFARMGYAEGFAWVNRVAEAAGNLCLVWDEADLFMRYTMPPDAFRLWNTGRHQRLHILACSRRPATVPRDLRANLSRLVLFRMDDDKDLRAVGDFADDGELITAVRTLPAVAQGQAPYAVDWQDGQGWRVRRSLFP